MKKNKIKLTELEEDKLLGVELFNDTKLLRENEYNVIIDANEQFIKERENSNRFNIYGKLKMVFKNQYSGTTGFTPLLKKLYLENDGTGIAKGNLPYDEFAFIRNDISYLYNETPMGNDLVSYTPQIKLKNNPEHYLIGPMNNATHNWGFCLSYAFEKDSNYIINYTFSNGVNYQNPISEGIPFRVIETDTHYILTSPVKHGIKDNEFILISNNGCTFYKNIDNIISVTTDQQHRIFQVESRGNEIHGSEEYVINISKRSIIKNTILSGVIFGRRCIDRNKDYTISQYYVRKHKILSDETEISIDKLGFETNIWEHERKILFENALGDNDVVVDRNRMETILYNVNNDFILKDLKDNRGLIPKEIFLTIYFKNGNGYFNYPPKTGYRFNFHDKWISKHFEGNTSNENGINIISRSSLFPNEPPFICGQLNKGDILNGDIVEYNEFELKEYVISDTYHKITSKKEKFNHGQDTSNLSFSGVNSDNMFGLYYKTHYSIKLREESPYIETSEDKNITNLPENSKYFPEEKQWRWRDLYEHGYVDDEKIGLNFPFMNGKHYVTNNINFYLRSEYYYTNKKDEIKNFDKPQNDFC